MFSSEKKKSSGMQESSLSERNRISKKTVLKGTIESQGDFRIEGVLEGDLTTTGRVILGPEGKITGKVKCEHADIEGVVDGYLEVQKSLTLKTKASVTGEVFMESLTVAPGATFNANCKMISELGKTKLKPIGEPKQKAKAV